MKLPGLVAVVSLLAGSVLVLADEPNNRVGNLPANMWVPIKPATLQPTNADEKGEWNNVGWNKLVYDADGKRVLFYDRWQDKKHGGYTIYGNCLFSFDPTTAKLIPIKIDNWGKENTPNGGYRTLPLLDNDKEPTPCPRHVYYGFDYAPDLKAVFLCNGANQSAMLKGKLRGHGLCTDTWRLDVEKKSWARIDTKEQPRNDLEDGMAYCPVTRSIVYAGHGKLWIFDVAKGQWRKAKNDLPRGHMGMTVFFDPPCQRILLAGGGTYGKWQTKAGGFNSLYAFDPKNETVSKLADCPTALCRAGLAYDSKRDLFIVAVRLKGEGVEQPSGMFAYNPKKDVWQEIKPVNAVPMENGWLPLCYDSTNDCLVGMVRTTFYAFAYRPK